VQQHACACSLLPTPWCVLAGKTVCWPAGKPC
jgi:hypothetical protein